MPTKPDDDLFAESTMTFGEHLEELRHALIYALSGLMVGFILGLCGANWVVETIKRPLKIALEEYHVIKSLEDLHEEYPDNVTEEIETFVQKEKYVYDEIYIEVAEFNRLQKWFQQKNEQPDKVISPPAENKPGPPSKNTEEDMAQTRFWRKLDPGITTLNPQEAFLIWLKAGLVAGIVLSSPWVFWHIWHFVAAGLYRHERTYVYIFLPFSLGLFLLGVALAYFFVFEHVLNFLLSFNRKMNLDAEPRISEWLNFVLFLPLGFGISFQLPLVMLFLERIGVFSVKSYLSKWRIAVLVIFVIAMFLTPADPISMLLMACPLTFLYFGGVLLCKLMPNIHPPLESPESITD